MTEHAAPGVEDTDFLRQAIHNLNNHIGVILTSAELLQLDIAAGKAKDRSALIERKALDARQILSEIARRYLD